MFVFSVYSASSRRCANTVTASQTMAQHWHSAGHWNQTSVQFALLLLLKMVSTHWSFHTCSSYKNEPFFSTAPTSCGRYMYVSCSSLVDLYAMNWDPCFSKKQWKLMVSAGPPSPLTLSVWHDGFYSPPSRECCKTKRSIHTLPSIKSTGDS